MVSIQVLYEGDLHCQATHGPSSTLLTTDAPVDNQGRGESFSPTDLVATALATCMVTTMGIAARKNGWELTGSRVRVEKHMLSDPRRIGKLEVRIDVPQEQAPEVQEELRHIALTCPVQLSIHPDIEVPVQFRWGVGA